MGGKSSRQREIPLDGWEVISSNGNPFEGWEVISSKFSICIYSDCGFHGEPKWQVGVRALLLTAVSTASPNGR